MVQLQYNKSQHLSLDEWLGKDHYLNHALYDAPFDSPAIFIPNLV